MILSDRDIRERLALRDHQRPRLRCLVVDPIPSVQPASVDLRLGHRFRVQDNYSTGVIYPGEHQDLTREVTIDEDGDFLLHPGEFVLGTTLEWIEIPHDLVGRMEGKSSLGRLGLQVHATAGFFDPGFRGTGTLELSNVSRLPVALRPGMSICQMSFMLLTSPAERPYGHAELNSKYLDQDGPVASRYGHHAVIPREG